jgi:hypothetical protein
MSLDLAMVLGYEIKCTEDKEDGLHVIKIKNFCVLKDMRILSTE